MWDVIKRSQDFHCDTMCAQSWGRSRNFWLKGLKIILTQPKHTPFCSILGYTKSNRWLTSNMCSLCCKNFSVRQVLKKPTGLKGAGVKGQTLGTLPLGCLASLTTNSKHFSHQLIESGNNFQLHQCYMYSLTPHDNTIMFEKDVYQLLKLSTVGKNLRPSLKKFCIGCLTVW